MTERQSSGDVRRALETVDLDSLGVELKTLLLVGEELQDVLALVALELDDLAHLGVVHNGSIAGKFLLDHFKDLFLVKLLGETLDSRQGLSSISLCERLCQSNDHAVMHGAESRHRRRRAEATGGFRPRLRTQSPERRTLDADMDIILGFLGLASVFVGFGEGVCNIHRSARACSSSMSEESAFARG